MPFRRSSTSYLSSNVLKSGKVLSLFLRFSVHCPYTNAYTDLTFVVNCAFLLMYSATSLFQTSCSNSVGSVLKESGSSILYSFDFSIVERISPPSVNFYPHIDSYLLDGRRVPVSTLTVGCIKNTFFKGFTCSFEGLFLREESVSTAVVIHSDVSASGFAFLWILR